MIPLVNPGLWAYRSILTSTQANSLQTNITYALDKRAGQADTLSSQITVPSTGSITFTNASSIAMQSSSTIELQSTAILLTDNGSHSTFNGNVNLGALTTFVTGSSFNGNMRFTGSSSTSTVGSYTVISATTGIQLGATSNQIDFTEGGASPSIMLSIADLGGGSYIITPPTITGAGNSWALSGQTSTTAAGGPLFISAGVSSTSTGGILNLSGGTTFGSGTNGGDASVVGGGGGGTNCTGGNLFLSGGIGSGSGTKGNICLNHSSIGSFAGGSGVISIVNCNVAPTGTPTNAGILYVSAGALMYKGSSGTPTVIAPA